ncbi:hypothetical protein HMPREF1092_00908 [Clostridium thermobutyricum]|uniref:Uncharacterized protein n=2 Tax=Clostridium thermobutyricum TaxID=29372 RepID=N9Y0M3_9CLOT|nr:hypothetical protein HMPREF1092_00908 [Clostridium thermobutyricum]
MSKYTIQIKCEGKIMKKKKCKKILKAYEMRKEEVKIVAEILEEIQMKPTEKSKENGRKLIKFFDEIEGKTNERDSKYN